VVRIESAEKIPGKTDADYYSNWKTHNGATSWVRPFSLSQRFAADFDPAYAGDATKRDEMSRVNDQPTEVAYPVAFCCWYRLAKKDGPDAGAKKESLKIKRLAVRLLTTMLAAAALLAALAGLLVRLLTLLVVLLAAATLLLTTLSALLVLLIGHQLLLVFDVLARPTWLLTRD
jgi:hypothetical protein